MNSGEIARLAGVSVRTLRHYHQVGVLPEPARRGNGYREYTVGDLILLLRIRHLTGLGVPLDEVPALLASTARADSVLEQLDGELAGQIARLTARREVIAQLRTLGASPDLPPELAGLLALTHRGMDLPPGLLAQDRDLSVLLHHLLDEDGRRRMADLYAALARPGLLESVTALSHRFAALDGQTPEDEVEDLLDEYARTLGEVAGGDDHLPSDVTRVESLFADYQDLAFNDRQRTFLARVAARFEELSGGAEPPG